MKRPSLIVVVALAVLSVSCTEKGDSSPASTSDAAADTIDPALVQLRGYRSKGRDADGLFAWYDEGASLRIVLPRVDTSRVALVDRQGAVPYRTVAEGDVLTLSVEPGAPLDRPELRLDGRAVRRFRLRRVPSDPADAISAYFEAVEASRKGFEAKGIEQVDVWLDLVAHPQAALAQAETARILSSAAYALYKNGGYERALALLDRAERLARAVEDDVRVGYIYFHRGQLAHYVGAHVAAIERYRVAMRTARTFGDEKLAEATALRMAVTLATIGRVGEALEVIESTEHEHIAEAGWVANVELLRFLAMDAGLVETDLEAIRRAFARSGDLYEMDEDWGSVANLRAREAAVLLRQGNVVAARSRLDAIEGKTVAANAAFEELVRARTLLAEGEYQLAGRKLEAMLGRGQGARRCEAMHVQGLVAEARGVSKRALERYRAAVACLDALDERFASFGERALFRFTRRGPYEDVVRALVADGRPAEAFVVADQERAAILERHVVAQSITDHFDEWIAYQSAREAAEKAAHEGCAFLMPGPAHRACSLRLDALKARVAHTRDALNAAMPHRERRPRDAAWMSRLRAALGEGRALLLVSGHGEDALHLLVDRAGVASTTSDPLARWSKRLAKVEHLYVVPDWHPASYDPFEAERTFPVSFLPHADVLLQAPVSSEGPHIVVADPDGTLPISAEEGKRVHDAIGGQLVFSANRAALLEAYRSASVLHYVGHATGRPGDPWSVELRLAGGESVNLFDLLRGQRRPELVVLNGCATGPPSRAGGGGLPAALVHLGVKNVIATTRVQADGEISAFVNDFYAEGALEDPAGAFHRAAKDRVDGSAEIVRLWGR